MRLDQLKCRNFFTGLDGGGGLATGNRRAASGRAPNGFLRASLTALMLSRHKCSTRCRLIWLQALVLALCFGQPDGASAEPIAEFYRQRTITFVSVFAPGGTYDFYSRLVATHLPNFIPGNPRVIIQYLPGAGGLTGAVHLATQAAQDGTVIGMVDRAIAVNQVQRTRGVPLEASKFHWIGSVSSYGGVLQVAGRTGVKTADDLRRVDLVLGSWGVETSSYTMPYSSML